MEHFPIRSWTVRARPSAASTSASALALSSCNGGAASNSSVRTAARRLASATPDRGQLVHKRPGRPAPFDKELAACPIATWLLQMSRGRLLSSHSLFSSPHRVRLAESGLLSGVRHRLRLSQFVNSLAIHHRRSRQVSSPFLRADLLSRRRPLRCRPQRLLPV